MAIARRGGQGFLRRYAREALMFTVGAFGFLHEVFLVQPPAERPFLIAGSLALMGLPFVLQGDTVLRGGGKTPEQRAEEERAERAKRKASLEAQLKQLDDEGRDVVQ